MSDPRDTEPHRRITLQEHWSIFMDDVKSLGNDPIMLMAVVVLAVAIIFC